MVRKQGRASTPSETAKYHPEYKTRICLTGRTATARAAKHAHSRTARSSYAATAKMCAPARPSCLEALA